ncbi:hypothetical protein VTJ49DRAFT_3292 [Mycothermus thermophilus]|uniref:F-box domain-containing protein n=1 Tax=Humicola insolens TaxID=85995 RepID=A0ABR3V9U8_HUMIN
MSILHLPHELVAYVVGDLDLDDIYSLGRTCRHFASLVLHEQRFTKWLLEHRAPFSAETREAEGSGNYARQFRRLLKRREAITSVTPFLVALVAYANEWSYDNGVLCYTRGLELRMLDLHGSAKHEAVIDVRALVQKLSAWYPRQRYSLRVLHYSHSIVSCLYKQASPYCPSRINHWLLALRVSDGTLIATRELTSVSNLFVRNNDRFLYYGYTSEPDAEGHEYWSIGMFLVASETGMGKEFSLPEEVRLPEAIGTDVGSTVCFEIYDDYFYILSSQRTLDVEGDDWASYYLCLRYPLGENSFYHAEQPPDQRLWRRNHKEEGPLDDRWAFLRLARNEATGQLQAIECRQEYPPGSAKAKRTYYTTPIDFGQVTSYPDDETATGLKHPGPRPPRDPHLVQPGDDNAIAAVFCPERAENGESLSSWDRSCYAALKSLCLTSRRFHSVAICRLYRHLKCRQKWWLLARTLVARPDLAAHARLLEYGHSQHNHLAPRKGAELDELKRDGLLVAAFLRRRRAYLATLQQTSDGASDDAADDGTFEDDTFNDDGSDDNSTVCTEISLKEDESENVCLENLFKTQHNLPLDLITSLLSNLESLNVWIWPGPAFRFLNLFRAAGDKFKSIDGFNIGPCEPLTNRGQDASSSPLIRPGVTHIKFGGSCLGPRGLRNLLTAFPNVTHLSTDWCGSCVKREDPIPFEELGQVLRDYAPRLQSFDYNARTYWGNQFSPEAMENLIQDLAARGIKCWIEKPKSDCQRWQVTVGGV